MDWIGPPCTPPPPPPETSLTGIFLFSRISWVRKKNLTETNIGMNFMLAPFFHRYLPDDVSHYIDSVYSQSTASTLMAWGIKSYIAITWPDAPFIVTRDQTPPLLWHVTCDQTPPLLWHVTCDQTPPLLWHVTRDQTPPLLWHVTRDQTPPLLWHVTRRPLYCDIVTRDQTPPTH